MTPNIRKDGRSGVILLVEDDPADRALTRRALKKCGSAAELYAVEDGEQAMAYLRETGEYATEGSAPRPDVVLLDLNMPRLDGRGVIRAIRADAALRTLPVVALTTSNSEVDISQLYELGVNSYITKPASHGEFTDVLKSVEHYWFRTVDLPPA